jgi:hypothetical protein
MSDTTRCWERLRGIGSYLASNPRQSLAALRQDVAEAAQGFETATSVNARAHAVHVFLEGLLGVLEEMAPANDNAETAE